MQHIRGKQKCVSYFSRKEQMLILIIMNIRYENLFQDCKFNFQSANAFNKLVKLYYMKSDVVG